MSKQAHDLCTLLVDDIYGEIASRAFKELLCYGRLSFPTLLYHSHLTPHQLKHGLAVLVQQHLVFWYTSEDDVTTYEANINAAYALIRSGKYIQVVESKFGKFASEIVSNVLFLGHVRIGDLVHTYKVSGAEQLNAAVKVNTDTATDEFLTKTTPRALNDTHTRQVQIVKTLYSNLYDLLRAELISTLHESHFRSDADNRSQAEKETPCVDIGRNKKKELELEREKSISRKLQNWRYGSQPPEDKAAEFPEGRKRFLQDAEPKDDSKRMRLQIPYSSHAPNITNPEPIVEAGAKAYLNDDLVLRVNYDKFAVIMRNQQLIELCGKSISQTTAKVYAEVLQRIETKIRQCKSFRSSLEVDEGFDPSNLPQIATHELGTLLRSPSIAFTQSIAHVSPEKMDQTNFDRLEPLSKKSSNISNAKEEAAVNDGASSGDEENEGDFAFSGSSPSDAESFPSSFSIGPEPKYSVPTVAVPESTAINSNLASNRTLFSHIRQHLLLLCEHPYHFLHRLPRTSSAPEKWTVDFPTLSSTLSHMAITQIASSRYGPLAARLINILTQKGKLDDKTLSTYGLMNLKTMRSLLNSMQLSGLIQIQEIPRDANRQPSRTLYLWSFDLERAKHRVLEDCYLATDRLVRRLRIEKDKVRSLIEKAGRSDVQGREEEFLTEAEMGALRKWRAVEEQIWGQVGRLDDIMCILRDY